jgi:Protein of unknown function (DUF3995)
MTWLILFGLLNGIILVVLSSIHFYWAGGGKAGIESTLPTDLDGRRVLNPEKIDSALVGVFLLIFALLFFHKAGILDFYLPRLIGRFGRGVITFIFLLRAMGDFRYVGFSKKIKSTRFAELDTKYFSPLCLLLGVNGVLLEILV